MIKWFVYIVFLLASAPCLLSAKTKKSRDEHAIVLSYGPVFSEKAYNSISDTIKTLKASSKNDPKVKEVPKPKKQSKPEKVEEGDATKEKAKRQRRPDGMERPPEIPRRNDN
ncbi:hypothetical protein [Mucilaginibacter boryungensis]|uniref:Uncharacterized protein n=1 Tax=Mucilaginibacter boryungensis TaxID=768480 RepID=A0ABR9XMC5_9SPHI|nr:hypothetical protein [Mucilaginibacter boryungensis]MBE9668431.1 hypothetical protein [Mucilaginibacter boryungensis]